MKYNPEQVEWEITSRCNLNCLHCRYSTNIKEKKELTTEESINLVKDLTDIGTKTITIKGGEVFLRNDWKKIAEEIKDSGIKLSIISNGYLEPTRLVKDMAKLEIDSFMVRIDSAKAEIQDSIKNKPGSFEKTLEFVKTAKKAGVPTGIVTNVNKINLIDLPEIKDMVYDEELDWQIQPAIFSDKFPKPFMLSDYEYISLDKFIKTVNKDISRKTYNYRNSHILRLNSKLKHEDNEKNNEECFAGKYVLGVMSNGNAKGCLSLSNEYIEGNIRKKKH